MYLELLETNVFIVVAILLNISFVFFMSFWSVWKNSNSSQIATRAERVMFESFSERFDTPGDAFLLGRQCEAFSVREKKSFLRFKKFDLIASWLESVRLWVRS